MSQAIQLLKDPEIAPSEENVRKVIDSSLFDVYKEIYKTITNPELELNPEWNYYRDGKAWLCKVVYKKKTVFWLSVWDKYLKAGFYFVERHRAGVMDLPIDEKIKHDFEEIKLVGKLIPLIMDIDSKNQLKDLVEVIKYKKSLK